MEQRREAFNIEEIGGKNNELVYERDPHKNNPFHDFVSEFKTNLDKLKYGVFMYSYWAVLAIVYLTGTSRISLLCMGYVILSFFFLWYGQTFLMKPIEKILKSLVDYLCFYYYIYYICIKFLP
jgi:piezo-type mechanosensitive ion channel component 1/2